MAEPSRRGFSAMDKNKQREIASKGGKAAHAKGTAHEFTPEEAREAGRKGGARSRERRLQRQGENQNAGESPGGPPHQQDHTPSSGVGANQEQPPPNAG